MAKSKEKAMLNAKPKGIVAVAKVLAQNAVAAAAVKPKHKSKPVESDENEPPLSKRHKEGEEEEEEEELEEEEAVESRYDSSPSTSLLAVGKESARSDIKNGAAELATLKGEAANLKIKQQIAVAKKRMM